MKSHIASTTGESDLLYKVSLAYYRYGYHRGYLQGEKGAAENLVNADFTLSAPIDRRSSISLDCSFDYVGYSRLQSAANYGMISLNPRYDWRNEHVAFAVGVKADVSFNNGTILRFSPDVRFDWTIVPDVQFYTAFTGGKKLNTWRSVSAYTLYFNPSAQVDNS